MDTDGLNANALMSARSVPGTTEDRNALHSKKNAEHVEANTKLLTASARIHLPHPDHLI